MAFARYYRAPAVPPDLKPLVDEARRTQEQLRHQVSLKDDLGVIRTVAGIDAGYDMARNLTKAVAVLLDFDTLELTFSAVSLTPTDFPYIPGFLSFREIPAILESLACLPRTPDLLMVDGQGVAHPRRLGIAAHLGVVTGLPSIGVAKSRLCGSFAAPEAVKGRISPLMDKGEQIGHVLCSKDKCNPLFISAGHRISHDTALRLTQKCLTTYRLPEPTRLADHMSKWVL